VRFELGDVALGGYAWPRAGASTVIVLLHGWAEDASTMAGVAERLRDFDVQVLSLSLRGWRGSSGVSDYGRSDPVDLSRVLARLGDDWNVDRVFFLGFSMGGLIALLTCTLGDSLPLSLTGALVVNPVTHLPTMYAQTSSEAARRYFDATLLPEQWRESSPLTHADRLACPILVAVGLDDEICPPDQGRRLVTAVPSSELLEVAGMVHRPSPAEWDVILERTRMKFGWRSAGSER
jgi:pimeloyl-ACP methyl ester carboxylesterase